MAKSNNNNAGARKRKAAAGRKTRSVTTTRPLAAGSSFGQMEYSIQTKGAGHIVVRGHELLGEVRTGGAAVPGGVLGLVADLNPACWVNSRLKLIASAYDKYRFNSVSMAYIPSVAATTNGTTTVFVETDPDERLPVGPGSVGRVLNYQFVKTGAIWQQFSCQYRRNVDDREWYIASAVATSRANNVQATVGVLCDGPDNTTVGRLLISYEVEFIYPELEYVDGGLQYFQTTGMELNAAAAGADMVANVALAGLPANARFCEIRPETNLPSAFVQAVGNWFDALAGQAIYLGFTGTTWLVYRTLESARANSGNLKWTNAVAAAIPFRWIRPITTGTSNV